MGSNPLLINGFFEHARRGRMTIFWIFWFGTLTAFPVPPHRTRWSSDGFDPGSAWWSDESDALSQIDVFIILRESFYQFVPNKK